MMELSWTLGPDQSAGDRHSLQGLASRLKHNLITTVAATTVDIRLCAKIINCTDLDKYNFLFLLPPVIGGSLGINFHGTYATDATGSRIRDHFTEKIKIEITMIIIKLTLGTKIVTRYLKWLRRYAFFFF